MELLESETEVLWYIKDGTHNISQTYMYNKFPYEIMEKLIVESYIAYGPYDSFVLTEMGEEVVIRPTSKTIGKNYTRPNDKNHVDDSSNWLASALIFAHALSNILRENEGIVVRLENDMQKLDIPEPNFGKVIVYNYNSQVHIVNCDKDLDDGQLIWMDHENDEL